METILYETPIIPIAPNVNEHGIFGERKAIVYEANWGSHQQEGSLIHDEIVTHCEQDEYKLQLIRERRSFIKPSQELGDSEILDVTWKFYILPYNTEGHDYREIKQEATEGELSDITGVEREIVDLIEGSEFIQNDQAAKAQIEAMLEITIELSN